MIVIVLVILSVKESAVKSCLEENAVSLYNALMKKEREKNASLHTGFWRARWARYCRSVPGVIALIAILFFVVVALFAPVIANNKPVFLAYNGKRYAPALANHKDLVDVWDYKEFVATNDAFALFPLVPYSPYRTDLSAKDAPPSRAHLMGTDQLGRDILARMIHGATVTLTIGLVATLIAIGIGVILGALAGYLGGAVDAVISRCIEIVICFPTLFILILVVSLFRPNIFLLAAFIGLFGWTGVARLIRGEFMRLKNMEFVEAAKVAGIPAHRIALRHIFPNALTPALVYIAFLFVGAALSETSLSYLGLGVQPPAASWGQIMAEAPNNYSRWWLFVFPGLAVVYVVIGFNLIGETLRDALDPKSAL